MTLSLRFEGSKGVKNLDTRFGNKGVYSLIAPECLDDLGPLIPRRSPLQIPLSDNTITSVSFVTILDFYIENICLSDEFLIVDGLGSEVVIGEGTMRKWGLKLDIRNKLVSVDHRSKKPILVNLH